VRYLLCVECSVEDQHAAQVSVAAVAAVRGEQRAGVSSSSSSEATPTVAEPRHVLMDAVHPSWIPGVIDQSHGLDSRHSRSCNLPRVRHQLRVHSTSSCCHVTSELTCSLALRPESADPRRGESGTVNLGYPSELQL